MATTTPIWRTKDGREIAIADMTDSHLRNALRMVERRMEAAKFGAIDDAYGFLGHLNGEMAQDSVESWISRMENCDTIDLMAAQDGVSEMLMEANRRGLNWRESV